MSQENVELALAMARAFNRRDWDAFVALAHDEIQLESRLVAMKGAYRGHEGLRRWWDNFLGVFPDYAIEVEELRDLGDVTLAHIRGWGHGADSATPVIDPFWQPLRWREGKCVWWRNCATEAEALEAAGVSEQSGATASRTRPWVQRAIGRSSAREAHGSDLPRVEASGRPGVKSGARYRCERPATERESSNSDVDLPHSWAFGGFEDDAAALTHAFVLWGVDGHRHSPGGGWSGIVGVPCAARLRGDDGLDDGSDGPASLASPRRHSNRLKLIGRAIPPDSAVNRMTFPAPAPWIPPTSRFSRAPSRV